MCGGGSLLKKRQNKCKRLKSNISRHKYSHNYTFFFSVSKNVPDISLTLMFKSSHFSAILVAIEVIKKGGSGLRFIQMCILFLQEVDN